MLSGCSGYLLYQGCLQRRHWDRTKQNDFYLEIVREKMGRELRPPGMEQARGVLSGNAPDFCVASRTCQQQDFPDSWAAVTGSAAHVKRPGMRPSWKERDYISPRAWVITSPSLVCFSKVDLKSQHLQYSRSLGLTFLIGKLATLKEPSGPPMIAWYICEQGHIMPWYVCHLILSLRETAVTAIYTFVVKGLLKFLWILDE